MTKGVAETDSRLEDHERHANQSKQTEVIPPSTKELNIQTSDMSNNEQGIISPLGDSKQGIVSPMEEITENDTSCHNIHARAKNQRQRAKDHSDATSKNRRVSIQVTPTIRASAVQALGENKECTRQQLTSNSHSEGLKPPIIEAMGKMATGAETEKLRMQNKQRKHALQDQQEPRVSLWTTHTGKTVLPTQTKLPDTYQNKMCPARITKAHPAGELLAEWAQFGCPTKTGCPWLKEDI